MAYKHFNSKKYGTISVWYFREGNTYTFSVGEIISEEEACIIQTQLGYNPNGYGFINFSDLGGTKWQCWSTCD